MGDNKQKSKWDQLSLSQKAGLIKIYVNNGFSDIDSIREDYNKNVENFQSNDANFVQRLRDNDPKYVQNADGNVSTHKLNYATDDNGAIIYPSVQEHNGTLVDHSEDNMGGLESAIQQKDTVRTSIPFAEWYTKNYKNNYSEFFNRYNKFNDGGKDKHLFNKEKVINRVYGDNLGTSRGHGSAFPIIRAITQYLTNKDSAVSDRIEYLEKIRELLPEKTLDAKANLMKRRLAGEISDKELWEGAAAYSLEGIKQHEDAKRIYLGYEPKYGTMEPSKYQPTIGKASNPYQVNALLSDEEFENIIFPLWQQWKSGDITDFVRTGKWNGKKQDFKKEPRIENYGRTALIKDIPYLSNATLSEGFDDKGQYISLFDTWDYNTGYTGKSGDNIGKWIGGKPFDIYQRYYLDEWLDIPKEDRGNPYIVPAIVIANKKANGGDITSENAYNERQPSSLSYFDLLDNFYNNTIYAEGGFLNTIKSILSKFKNTTKEPDLSSTIDLEDLALKQGWTESKYIKGAKSKAGAIGDYQIMPAVHKQYLDATGIEGDLTDSDYNKKVRDWYVDWLSKRPYLNRANNDTVKWSKIMAAYNWGNGNVLKALNKAKEDGINIYDTTDWLSYTPKETQDYVNFIVNGIDTGSHRTDALYKAFKKLKKSKK